MSRTNLAARARYLPNEVRAEILAAIAAAARHDRAAAAAALGVSRSQMLKVIGTIAGLREEIDKRFGSAGGGRRDPGPWQKAHHRTSGGELEARIREDGNYDLRAIGEDSLGWMMPDQTAERGVDAAYVRAEIVFGGGRG